MKSIARLFVLISLSIFPLGGRSGACAALLPHGAGSSKTYAPFSESEPELNNVADAKNFKNIGVEEFDKLRADKRTWCWTCGCQRNMRLDTWRAR